MKTYVEMADSALKRIAEYEKRRRARRARLVRTMVPAVSFCLVMLLGVGAWKGGLFEGNPGGTHGQIGGDPESGKTPGQVGSNPDGRGSTQQAEDRIIINPVEVSGGVSADMDVQFEEYSPKLPPDVWEKITEEFYEASGITYEDFTGRLEQTTELVLFYTAKIRGYKDAGLDDEYKNHDYVFVCRTESGGNVTVALCPDELPLRDCLVVCDNPQQSVINGNYLEIIQFKFRDSYQVNFRYQDANYDIEARNVTQEELEKLLRDILDREVD